MRLLSLALCVNLFAAPTIHAQESGSTVDELIARGRTLLEARNPEEALPLFEEAAAADGESLDTRRWVLRAWMDLGRTNDTLDALDELERAGEKGPLMNYLYGMAFVRRAEVHIADGVTDSSIQMNFLDGMDYLAKSIEAAPELFPDAYQPLAFSAWQNQELELAAMAAEIAVEHYPRDPLCWLTEGRIAMSRFVVEQEGDSPATWGSKASAHYKRAERAFVQAVETAGSPGRASEQRLLANAALELGNNRMWMEARGEATKAYATAIAWAPEAVDFPQIVLLLEESADSEKGQTFNRTLEEAAKGFAEHFDDADPRYSLVLWWLGWSRYDVDEFAAAESAFVAALERNPEAVNAWFYVGMARYHNEDWEGSAQAFIAGWDTNPVAIIDEMKVEPELNAAKVDYVLGQIYTDRRLEECAVLAEISAETAQTNELYWNNLGIFLRDRSDQLEEDKEVVHDPKVIRDLHERAFAAYTRALELAPDDPQMINDTAVMLHYYLERDLDKAAAMYARARGRAEELLANEELDENERARIEKTLKDSIDNLELVLKLIEERSADETTAHAPACGG